MDNLTHSLVGALLGQAGLKKTTGLAMPALIIGANLPDVDAACFFWLEGTEHLGFRRGITHGPPAMVLLPLILAGLLWGFDRWQEKRGKRPEGRRPVSFKWLFLLSFVGCLTHPALDWLNVYGIRLLEPFSSHWFYGDTLFIIDVWLWALMGLATWLSLRREKKGGDWIKPARVAIAVSLAYIGLNGVISSKWEARLSKDLPVIVVEESESVLTFQENPDYRVIASPVPLLSFQRELITGTVGEWYARKSAADMAWDEPIADTTCVWPDLDEKRQSNSQLDAFLFWSRAPFASRAEDGSVVLHDARFYDPRARDRFSVALPDVECVELPAQ